MGIYGCSKCGAIYESCKADELEFCRSKNCIGKPVRLPENPNIKWIREMIHNHENEIILETLNRGH